jgi:Cdc6-like AAA superfamily ATPase
MEQELITKINTAGQIYTPAYPIEIKELFSGRSQQLSDIIGIVPQKGRHLIIYGDRGVGKTSFANIIKVIFESPDLQVAKISCNSNDTFQSLWHNVFSKLNYNYEEAQKRIGFGNEIERTEKSLIFSNLFSKEQIDIQSIMNVLNILANPIIILDEFDRLNPVLFDKRLFTDLVKAVADSIPYVTIIIVGVSEDVGSLIQEHGSIERNLGQIHLPSMTPDEVRTIIVKGEEPLGIKYEANVIDKIIDLSSGYPHFTHSLCYYAACAAIWTKENSVNMQHLSVSIKQTIDQSHESLRNSYRTATLATKKNIFQEVLYAASLVQTDEYGYFQANDLDDILSKILNKEMKVNNFTFHLGKFCSEERGEIFKMTGAKNRHRYKFKNPLMKAFIKLKIEAID